MARQPQSLTPAQLRVARDLLGWSRERVAALSDTTVHFVKKFEDSGYVAPLYSRERGIDGLAAIRIALEAAGLELTNGRTPSFRLRA